MMSAYLQHSDPLVDNIMMELSPDSHSLSWLWSQTCSLTSSTPESIHSDPQSTFSLEADNPTFKPYSSCLDELCPMTTTDVSALPGGYLFSEDSSSALDSDSQYNFLDHCPIGIGFAVTARSATGSTNQVEVQLKEKIKV